jgi:hypothetical protein
VTRKYVLTCFGMLHIRALITPYNITKKTKNCIFFCLSNKISCTYLVALFDIRLCVNSFDSCLYLFNLFVMQVILEASVGSTGMSDIAVDDVTFVQGPCPGM